jgi:hypothetical protein
MNCLHLEGKRPEFKEVIGGDKWYPAFGYISGLGSLFFWVDEKSMWNTRWQF